MKLTSRAEIEAPEAGEVTSAQNDEAPRKLSALALMALAMLLVAGFLQLSPSMANTIASEFSGALSATESSTTTTSSIGAFSVYSPLISNGAVNLTYPTDYRTLATFALNLVNQDRANSTLSPVSLGESRAGQQHANSMLRYSYFSHFDTQGFKPYMRYTLLGGVGAVSENVAYMTWQGSHFMSTSSVEDSISTLEEAMMYNDSLCCNNGHRLNIINPLHNRVSLGLAYNSTTLYFVEEFENYYINLSYNVSKTYSFSMAGAFVLQVASPRQVYVTFDATPSPETPAQLNSGPKEYGPGDLVGGVLPPCSEGCTVFASGVTVRATVWQATPRQVNIAFDLSRFIQVYGAGVYTVYLVTGVDTSTALTSISVFVS
jgi:uncharacterized protein YkwD